MVKAKGRRRSKRSIGTAELTLLAWISENPDSTLHQIHADFGAERGYVKGTLIQMLKRLEKKRYVRRAKRGGSVYLYTATQDFERVANEEIDRLAYAAFGGSLGALAAHLASRYKEATAADKKKMRTAFKAFKGT